MDHNTIMKMRGDGANELFHFSCRQLVFADVESFHSGFKQPGDYLNLIFDLGGT
jgi:hypothetical protein